MALESPGCGETDTVVIHRLGRGGKLVAFTVAAVIALSGTMTAATVAIAPRILSPADYTRATTLATELATLEGAIMLAVAALAVVSLHVRTFQS